TQLFVGIGAEALPVAEEVALKLGRVRQWLQRSGYQAVLLTMQANVAWVTGGIDDIIARNEEPGQVWAMVDPERALLLTTNVEEPRLLAELDLERAGFELKVAPWYRPGGLGSLAEELAGGRAVANDGNGPGSALGDQLATLRVPLTVQEHARLAELGADCARALEGVMRDWTPEQSEVQVAGRIAAALEELRILPSVLLVGGAERRRAFRHPVPTSSATGQDVLAVIVGVRGGLNVACSRSASAGHPAADLKARHFAACLVEARMIAATRPGVSWQSALAAGQEAYSEAGYPGEWKAHWQGGPIGYYSREYDVVPGTETAARPVLAGSAFAWNPSVQGAKSEDTFIVGPERAVPVSNTSDWPSLFIETPEGEIARPAVLAV
ncbi:MAG: M24 family metallopeptidase, partial [Acidimicrobiales bacterium]